VRTSQKCGREARDGAKVGSAEGTLEEARKEWKTCPWLEGMGTWSEARKGMGNSVRGLEGRGKLGPRLGRLGLRLGSAGTSGRVPGSVSDGDSMSKSARTPTAVGLH
jgi:hypothetical protein